MPQFTYGAGEIAHLKNRDPHLGAAIDRIGWISREVMPDVFTALIHSLVAQQISNAAAATIRRRLGALLGDLTPLRVAQTPLTDLQACGVSRRKAEWIQHVAEQVIGGALDLSALHALPDAEVISTLSALPGVGVWTAEMLLIFSLGRPDVVSWGDQAIRRGMRRLYGLESLSRTEFARYRERYAPYGSVASFYLWALAGLPAETAGPAYPAPGSVLAGPRSTPP
jgi:DNA-3-methyladenine glycosylase II